MKRHRSKSVPWVLIVSLSFLLAPVYVSSEQRNAWTSSSVQSNDFQKKKQLLGDVIFEAPFGVLIEDPDPRQVTQAKNIVWKWPSSVRVAFAATHDDFEVSWIGNILKVASKSMRRQVVLLSADRRNEADILIIDTPDKNAVRLSDAYECSVSYEVEDIESGFLKKTYIYLSPTIDVRKRMLCMTTGIMAALGVVNRVDIRHPAEDFGTEITMFDSFTLSVLYLRTPNGSQREEFREIINELMNTNAMNRLVSVLKLPEMK